MPANMNKAFVLGHVGQDPIIKTFQNGDRVANFSVATSESWKDKTTGERKERVTWHRIAVFNQPLTELVEKHVRKGDKLFVEGQLETRKYTDSKSGLENSIMEIVLRPYRGEIVLMGGPQQRSPSPRSDGYAGDTPRRPANHDLDDEIPF